MRVVDEALRDEDRETKWAKDEILTYFHSWKGEYTKIARLKFSAKTRADSQATRCFVSSIFKLRIRPAASSLAEISLHGGSRAVIACYWKH